MKTVTNVNSYVAWAEFQGSRSAYAQGITESEEEFRQMCEEKGMSPLEKVPNHIFCLCNLLTINGTFS